jgi:hypothetical protein
MLTNPNRHASGRSEPKTDGSLRIGGFIIKGEAHGSVCDADARPGEFTTRSVGIADDRPGSESVFRVVCVDHRRGQR